MKGADGAELDLHAGITIVTGTDRPERNELLRAVASLVGDREIGMDGEVEVHGIVMPLSAETRSLLELDKADDVDLVVEPEVLPGHDPVLVAARAGHADATGRHAAAVERLDLCRSALGLAVTGRDEAKVALAEIERGEGAARELLAAAGAERSRLEFDLEVARADLTRGEEMLSEAVLARDVLHSAHVKARAKVADAIERRAEAALAVRAGVALLDELRLSPPPEVSGDDVTEARERLRTAERAARLLDPSAQETSLARQVTAMQDRWVELVQQGAALGEADARDAVQAALGAVVGDDDSGRPVVQALALADTWRDIHQQIGALDAGLDDHEREAEERVRRAMRAYQGVDARMSQPILTPDQVARVEAAHQALLDAQDGVSGRVGAKRRQRRVEQLRLDEVHVLGRLGFTSYADYMISTSSRGTEAAAVAELELARKEISEARAALDAIPGASDRARRRIELLSRKLEVTPRIVELLGHEPTGPETEDELRNMRERHACTPEDEARLHRALNAADVVVDGDLWERDDLVALARSYLAADQDVADERRAVNEAIDALEAAIAQLRVQIDLGATTRVHLEALPALCEVEIDARTDAARAWDEVDLARSALKEAEVAFELRRAHDRQMAERTSAWEEAVTQDEEASYLLTSAELDRRPEDTDRLTHAEDVVELREVALARAREREVAVTVRIDERSKDRALHDLAGAAADRLLEAEAELSAAAAAEQEAAAEAAIAGNDVEHFARLVAEREALVRATDRSALVKDVDWALLSRLAELRSVGLAGALPLVLDAPFIFLDDSEVSEVLESLARIAQTSQVLLFTDRPAILAWASGRSADQVAVV